MSDDHDTDPARCDYCGRRWDRPCSPGCKDQARHAAPDLAQRLVECVERFLDDREAIGWECLDTEILEDLRDEMATLLREELLLSGISRQP